MKKIILFLALILFSTSATPAFAYYGRCHYYAHSSYLIGRDQFQEEHHFSNCDEHSLVADVLINYYSDGTRRTFTTYTILDKNGEVLNTGCSDVKHTIYNNKHYFLIKKNKKYHILNANGQLLTRRNYTKMQEIGANRILVKHDKKYGIINLNETIIAPIKYKSIKPIGANLFITELNGYYGIMDNSHNVTVKNEYDKITPFYDTYLLKKQGEFGLADLNGKIILPPNHDKIKKLGEYILIKKDGKFGLLDNSGNRICDTEYRKIRLERNNIEILTDNGWLTIDDL